MQILGAAVATLMIFLLMLYFSLREDAKMRQARRNIDAAEFIKAEELESVPAAVLNAVFAELSEMLSYPPIASDRIGRDLGIDGSDLDDLILRLSDQLQITWDQPEPIEANIQTVADLAHFLKRALGN